MLNKGSNVLDEVLKIGKVAGDMGGLALIMNIWKNKEKAL